MNLLFDEDSQKLIIMAKKEMFNLKHPYVGSEHLLLAILSYDKLEITKILNNYGINYSNYKNEIISVVGIGSKNNNWFLFTPLLKRIINNASYYCSDSNMFVTPYNLLISILQEGDGVANRILAGMNIDLEALYNNLIADSYSLKENCRLFLDDLAINMNDKARKGKYDPVIGRDEQVERLMQILLRKTKNNPLLIGEAGVGKTAIVEELARRIVSGDVPSKLKNKIIYGISMSVLVAGTKYRGEFEEKLNKVIKEAINNKDIVLFIDEIHTLVGAGGAEGAIDASNIIKPYLARGDFKIIGATTNNEYKNSLAKDKALDRRFQKIYISEPSEKTTIEIIKNLKNIYELFHGVIIPDELIKEFVILSNKYLYYGQQPDKAIDLLDEACTYCSSADSPYSTKLKKLEQKIRKVSVEKDNSILSKSFKKALKLREEELILRNDYDQLLFSKNSMNQKRVLKIADIYKVISDKTGIPFGKILPERLKTTKKLLKSNCFGKNRIIESIIKFINDNYFNNSKVPISFLLVGKSGVGKTFLVEELAKSISCSDAFVKIDLSEYLNNYAVGKFMEAIDDILNKVKLYPFSIFLIDNINLCVGDVYDFLFKILENGYATNSLGERICFSNAIIFFTTTVNNNELGFNGRGSYNNNLYDKVSKVIVFKDVSRNDILKVLSKYINIDDSNLDELLEEIDYKNNGYRNLDVCVNKYMLNTKIKS